MTKKHGTHREHGNRKFMTILRLTLVGLILYTLLFALVFLGINPDQHDITVGSPAPVTIYATKDVKDAVLTDQKAGAAAAAVDNIYLPVDPSVQGEVLASLDACFTELVNLRETYTVEEAEAMSDEDIERVDRSLTIKLDRSHFLTWMNAEEADISALIKLTLTAVTNTLSNELKQGYESDAVGQIAQELLSAGYDASIVSTASAVVKYSIRCNVLIDTEATEAAKLAARAAVEDEMVVKGEVIVREGEIVTLSQYTMVSALGLLKDDTVDFQLMCGSALLVLLLEGSLALYLLRFERDMLLNVKRMWLLAIIIASTVALCLVLRQFNPYVMPVSLGLMLIALLIDQRLAVFTNFLIAILASLFASGSGSFFSMSMVSVFIMSAASGPIVSITCGKRPQRTAALIAGVLVGVGNFCVTLAVGIVTSSNVDTVLRYALWASLGAPVSAVLAIGLQPVLEYAFNLVTPAKLLELSNPNQPLLRRLQTEAPGTYHHSIIVANLAEAGCEAVGANGLLARVGAFYHDIGKLKRPIYFKENQMGDNPHERTDPRVSTAILTAHPRDGVLMAQKEHLPQAIQDMIQQHHGDTLVVYFYDKAKKMYGDDIDPDAFRYEGPRPRSREAAMIMLADVTEAASRTLQNPNPESLAALIRKLVHDRLTDGQLNECELTFKDLDRICGAFYTILSGAFHERIEYPEVELPQKMRDLPLPEEETERRSRHERKSDPELVEPAVVKSHAD